jgi:hypothetical protein
MYYYSPLLTTNKFADIARLNFLKCVQVEVFCIATPAPEKIIIALADPFLLQAGTSAGGKTLNFV